MTSAPNTVGVRAIPMRNPSLPTLTPEQQQRLAKAKQFAVQESVKHVLEKQKAQAQQSWEGVANAQMLGGTAMAGNDNMLLQKKQALILMCRVYVGSIYYDVTEETIRNAFTPFGPFKSINMSFDPITGKHKGFAFIEYECPEAAQLALEQMGGVTLGGRSIKVGRPANMPQNHPMIDLLLEESKKMKRLYVSSVFGDVSVEDLQSVFSPFGNVLYCRLAMDPMTNKHKGYGFLEYETLASANDAVSSMNLFDLGGMFLRVRKGIAPAGMSIPLGSSFNNNPMTANSFQTIPQPPMTTTQSSFQTLPTQAAIPPPAVVTPQSLSIPPPGVVIPNSVGGMAAPHIPPPGIAAPISLASKPQGQIKVENTELPNTLSAQENMQLSGSNARHMIMNKLMRKEQPTCVLVLKNMVTQDEVDDELEKDVTEECGKSGPVEKVIIYQEKQSEYDDTAVVKIFVKFANSASCDLSVKSLNGRWFGGRKIEAAHFPQAKFDHSDFTE